jgi:hypothetical protein
MPSLVYPTIHVVKIVDTCLNFSRGFSKLVKIVRDIDKNTQQVQALEALISQLCNRHYIDLILSA